MLSESTKQLIEASGGGTITNLPDDEDIQSVEDGTGSQVLKFNDRAYNPSAFSGKGYKILRKNIVDGKNVLTQEMINEENTVYEIRYDFDLNGAEINIPLGCTLKFEGGKFSNGKLNGENVIVYSIAYSILENIEFISNTQFLRSAYPEWFGAKGNGVDDDTNSIKKAIESVKTNTEGSEYPSLELRGGMLLFQNATYFISDTLDFRGINVQGNNATIKCNIGGELPCISINNAYTFYNRWIKDITIDCNKMDNIGIQIDFCNNLKILNFNIINVNYIGLLHKAGYELEVANFNIMGNNKTHKYGTGIISDTSDSCFHDGTITYMPVGVKSYKGTNRFYNLHIWGYNDVNKNNIGIELHGSSPSIHNVIFDTQLYNNTDYDCDYVIEDNEDKYKKILNGGCAIYVDNDCGPICSNNFTYIPTDQLQNKNPIYIYSLQSKGISDTQSIMNTNYTYSNIDLLKDYKSTILNRYDNLASLKFIKTSDSQFDVKLLSFIHSKSILDIQCNRPNPDTDEISYFNLSLPNNANIGDVYSSNYLKNINLQGFKIKQANEPPTKVNNVVYFDSQLQSLAIIKDNTIYDLVSKQVKTKAIFRGNNGEEPELSNTGYDIGQNYYDYTIKQPKYWDGTKWINYITNSGSFNEKPTNIPIGFQYFCTDRQTTEGSRNGIMIYYVGEDTWVDALGRVIS